MGTTDIAPNPGGAGAVHRAAPRVSSGRPRRPAPLYRWLEHTSEVELSLEGEGPAAILEEAVRALGELLAEAPPGEPARHEVEVSAPDLPALLAEWLGELVYLSETEAFIPERAEDVRVEGATVRAVVHGRRSVPQTLVKGITYHRLRLEEADGAWRGRVVLDV